mgnify:CR=1 FL=1
MTKSFSTARPLKPALVGCAGGVVGGWTAKGTSPRFHVQGLSLYLVLLIEHCCQRLLHFRQSGQGAGRIPTHTGGYFTFSIFSLISDKPIEDLLVRLIQTLHKPLERSPEDCAFLDVISSGDSVQYVDLSNTVYHGPPPLSTKN